MAIIRHSYTYISKRRFLLISLPVFTALLSGEFVAANSADRLRQQEKNRHAHCLQLTETAPEDAYEEALAWLSMGRTAMARHCTALALVALKHFEEAAARLEALANSPDAGSVGKRALYMAQAGNSWLLARRPQAAQIALNAGLKLAPENTGMLKDRARAYLLLRLWPEAEADLAKILQKYPDDTDALLLRARARLEKKEKLQLALSDIARARKIEPERIDILLLRGRVLEAIRLSSPDHMKNRHR